MLGQKLQLVTYDDQAKSDQAIFTANKLIGEDGVKFVVNGSYSASGRAAAPVFQKAGMLMISAYGVHPDITPRATLCSASCISGRRRARQPRSSSARRSASRRSPPSPWTTITGRPPWMASWAASKYGIEVVNKYSYSLKDRQFGSIVASVKRDNPDAVYATGYFFTGGPLVAQLRAAGITVPIIGSQAFDSEKFIEIAGPAAEGTYIIDSFDRDRKDEALQKFFSGFQKRAGYAPEGVAAITYSAVKLMADGIKRAGSADPAKVRDAIAATKNFPMLEGNLNGFNSLHEIIMPIHVNIDQRRQVHAGWRDHRSKRFAPPEK